MSLKVVNIMKKKNIKRTSNSLNSWIPGFRSNAVGIGEPFIIAVRQAYTFRRTYFKNMLSLIILCKFALAL